MSQEQQEQYRRTCYATKYLHRETSETHKKWTKENKRCSVFHHWYHILVEKLVLVL